MFITVIAKVFVFVRHLVFSCRVLPYLNRLRFDDNGLIAALEILRFLD